MAPQSILKCVELMAKPTPLSATSSKMEQSSRMVGTADLMFVQEQYVDVMESPILHPVMPGPIMSGWTTRGNALQKSELLFQPPHPCNV